MINMGDEKKAGLKKDPSSAQKFVELPTRADYRSANASGAKIHIAALR
jgi:hypothetical protein